MMCAIDLVSRNVVSFAGNAVSRPPIEPINVVDKTRRIQLEPWISAVRYT